MDTWANYCYRDEHKNLTDNRYYYLRRKFLTAMEVMTEEAEDLLFSEIYKMGPGSSEDRLWFRLFVAIKEKNFEYIGRWAGWYLPDPYQVAVDLRNVNAIKHEEFLDFARHYFTQRYDSLDSQGIEREVA